MGNQGLHADRPIAHADEDELERGPLTDQLARWVLDAPIDDGFVIGLTGPWGIGKSSVLGLLAQRLADEDVFVVRFEPWLFSTADELVPRFFDEVATQLGEAPGRRLRDLATKLAEYGVALSPVAGLIAGPAANLLEVPRELLRRDGPSASARRDALRAMLLREPHRIAVLVDDIDRLDAREIREVLRLVKLVADLPGVVHVLSFDRERVQRALLGTVGEDGRAYLEKIVQATLAVPPIARDRLERLTLEWLGEAIDGQPMEPWDGSVWSNIVDGGIGAYVRTLRDGRRFSNMAPAALKLCAGEVAPIDVLALEAIRVFDPDVHERLIEIAPILTGVSTGLELFGGQETEKRNRERLDAILSASSDPAAARKVLSQLFPESPIRRDEIVILDEFASHPKRVRRLAVLLRYLHLTLGVSEVPSATVELALEALADAARFEALLDEVDDTRLDDLLERVRAQVSEQLDIDVFGCATTALDLVPRLARTGGGFTAVRGSDRAVWFIQELLKTVQTPEQRADVAMRLVAGAPTLSLRLLLLWRLQLPETGPSRRPELDLIQGDDLQRARTSLADAVANASSESLAGEELVFELVRLLGETTGQPAARAALERHGVLSAVVSNPRAFHNIAGHDDSVDLGPLIGVAGDEVLELLDDLAACDDSVDEDLRREIQDAIRIRRSGTTEDRDASAT